MTKPAATRRAVFIDKDGTRAENVQYDVDPAMLRRPSHAALRDAWAA